MDVVQQASKCVNPIASKIISQINRSRNCAPPGGACCDEVSCNAGEKCCPGTSNAAFPCAPESSICCGDGSCHAGSTCCEGQLGCAQEGYQCCEGGKDSCPEDEKCCRDDDGIYCADECLPTITFPHQEGFSEEVSLPACMNGKLLTVIRSSKTCAKV